MDADVPRMPNLDTEESTEDAEDLAAYDERQHEPDIDFDDFVLDLKSRGKL